MIYLETHTLISKTQVESERMKILNEIDFLQNSPYSLKMVNIKIIQVFSIVSAIFKDYLIKNYYPDDYPEDEKAWSTVYVIGITLTVLLNIFNVYYRMTMIQILENNITRLDRKYANQEIVLYQKLNFLVKTAIVVVVFVFDRVHIASRRHTSVWLAIEIFIEFISIFTQSRLLSLKEKSDLNLIAVCYQNCQRQAQLIDQSELIEYDDKETNIVEKIRQ